MIQKFNIRWLALLAITLILIFLCWRIILPFLDVIIWSVVLAVVVYPFFMKVRRRVANPKWAAALITVAVVILVGLLPIALLVLSAAAQVPEGIEAAKAGIAKGRAFLAEDSRVANYVRPYLNPEELGEQLKGAATPLLAQSAIIAGGVLGVLVKIAFTLFALFYLLRDADAVERATFNLLPLSETQAHAVFKRCRDVIKASVQGVMVIAAIQGFLGGLTFAILGLPSSILWGFVMFIASLIPMLGCAIVWVPAAIFLAATGHPGQAGVLVFVGAIVIGSVDNLLRPRLVGSKAGLHDLVIFFSVLGGLQAFGVAGLFVGPVVVALTLAIIEVFRQMNPVGQTKADESKALVGTDGTALITPSALSPAPPTVMTSA